MINSLFRKPWFADRLLPILAGLIGLWHVIYYWIIIPIRVTGVDFPKHWYGAHNILAGQSPYIGEMYLAYPFFAGFIHLWLVLVPLEIAELPWDILNILLCLGGYGLIAWLYRPPQDNTLGDARQWVQRYWAVLCLAIVSLSDAIHTILLSANIDPINFFLSVAFTGLFLKKKDTASGIVLAALVLVKIAPIFLLLPVLAMSRWRIASACTGTLIVYALFLLVSGYWKQEIYLYQDVLPMLPWRWMVISKSIHRFLGETVFPGVLGSEAAYKQFCVVVNIIILAVYTPLLSWLFFTRSRRSESAALAFGYAMVLIIGPLLQENHLCWAVPALFIHLRLWASGKLPDVLSVILVVNWGLMLSFRTLAGIPAKLHLDIEPLMLVQTPVIILFCIVSGVAAFWTPPES